MGHVEVVLYPSISTKQEEHVELKLAGDAAC
jgi:hypothetical protein